MNSVYLGVGTEKEEGTSYCFDPHIVEIAKLPSDQKAERVKLEGEVASQASSGNKETRHKHFKVLWGNS